jgi:hypothetical protein
MFAASRGSLVHKDLFTQVDCGHIYDIWAGGVAGGGGASGAAAPDSRGEGAEN